MRFTSRTLPAFTLSLFVASAAWAGDYHRSADLVCSDCHAQHYTPASRPAGWEPGGPFPTLLVASSTNVLCLFCHDGSDPAAPDVLAPVAMYDGTDSETSAAGFFGASSGSVSPTSHDLGVPVPIPLRSDGRIVSLSCASCHAVHGNDQYRNLRTDPDSTALPVNLRTDSEIFVGVHPSIPPDRGASAQAYRSANTGYRAGLRDWCARCHDLMRTDAPGTEPAHHLRHPGEASMASIGAHVDLLHWQQGVGEGFGSLTGDGVEGIPRVRFQSPGAGMFTQARQVGPDNEVFCGSCHLAHGGTHQGALVWPYREGGVDDRSACAQCHNP
jgi:hypothetical protein